MNRITVHFDGGCKPTNPGSKYGSYEVLLNSRQIFKASRIELGWGTSNEAEFDVLIEALKWTSTELWKAGFHLNIYDVRLFSDSTVVVNRINGTKRGKDKSETAQRMARLAEQCRNMLSAFKSFTAEWNGRGLNVKRFGH